MRAHTFHQTRDRGSDETLNGQVNGPSTEALLRAGTRFRGLLAHHGGPSLAAQGHRETGHGEPASRTQMPPIEVVCPPTMSSCERSPQAVVDDLGDSVDTKDSAKVTVVGDASGVHPEQFDMLGAVIDQASVSECDATASVGVHDW